MHRIHLAILLAGATAAGCAHAIAPPALKAVPPPAEALVVLPGFGYSPAAERAFRALAPRMAADGFDLFLPTYLSRKGLYDSRVRLRRFLQDARLRRYQRVHVFAFIAGAWTLNRVIGDDPLPNLATVIYDRSPFQERAPRIAQERLPTLTWFRYGSAVADVARVPYFPMTDPGVRVGLLIETVPTPFITRFAGAADQQGPYRFECSGLTQRYDDCIYVPLNHSDLYTHFADLWPDVRSFIRGRRFTTSANRTPPIVTRLARPDQEVR